MTRRGRPPATRHERSLCFSSRTLLCTGSKSTLVQKTKQKVRWDGWISCSDDNKYVNGELRKRQSEGERLKMRRKSRRTRSSARLPGLRPAVDSDHWERASWCWVFSWNLWSLRTINWIYREKPNKRFQKHQQKNIKKWKKNWKNEKKWKKWKKNFDGQKIESKYYYAIKCVQYLKNVKSVWFLFTSHHFFLILEFIVRGHSKMT